jgi:hypothetical protein
MITASAKTAEDLALGKHSARWRGPLIRGKIVKDSASRLGLLIGGVGLLIMWAATMKAYLDNNVVSAIAKDDTPAESDALDRLLAAYEAGKVDLVTSELTLREIKAYQGPRRPLERTFRLLEKVPIVRWDQLMGVNSHGDNLTWINSPVIKNDPIYSALLTSGVQTVDSQHVFVATKNACGAFLTCDKGILQRSDAIKKLCAVAVHKPSGFVASHGW